MERVVALDMHLKKTQGTVMGMDGKITKQEKFGTNKPMVSGYNGKT